MTTPLQTLYKVAKESGRKVISAAYVLEMLEKNEKDSRARQIPK